MLGSCPVTVIIIYRVTAIYRVIIYRFDCSIPAYMGAVLHQSPDCFNTPKYPYLHKGISLAFRPLEFYREFSYSLDQSAGGRVSRAIHCLSFVHGV